MAVLALALAAPGGAIAAAQASFSAAATRDGTTWESWIMALINMMIQQLNCPSLQLPPDVPVAMMLTTDCYYTNGLHPMTLSERVAFLALLEEAEFAVNTAPPEFQQDVLKKFLKAIEDMRQAAQAVP